MELQRFFKIEISNSAGDLIKTPDNVDIIIGETPGYGISAGTMRLDEILCESELTLGAYNANKFEVEIYGLNYDVTGHHIYVYSEYGESRTHIFKGIIDSAKTDNKNGYRDIVAYDQMYNAREVNVGPLWDVFWNDHDYATLKDVRNGICQAMGFSLMNNQPSLPNDDIYLVDVEDTESLGLGANATILPIQRFDSLKFSTLLQMLCELQCCCPNMNRFGQLEFILMGQENATTTNIDPVDGDYGFDTNTANFEDYITASPTGFAIYSTSNECSQFVPALDNDNSYPISGNVFLLNTTGENIDRIVSVLVPYISRMVYMPAEIPMILSDLSLKVGDRVSTTQKGVSVNHYIMAQSFSGAQLIEQTIESTAYGEYLNSTASNVNDVIVMEGKYSKLSRQVDSISAEFGDNGRVTTIEASIDGLEVRNEDGTTTIGGDHIRTENLKVNRIWSYEGSNDCFADMYDSGLRIMLGQNGYVYMGYAEDSESAIKPPFLKLGTAQLDENGRDESVSGLVKRYNSANCNGMWIGDNADETSLEIMSGTGLFVNFNDNKIYKYIKGKGYVIADDETMIAKFG